VITGELKSKVDRVWDAFWSGGISNPLEVIEQITYLLYMRRLDIEQTRAESKANALGGPIENPVFLPDQQYLRWSRLKDLSAAEMHALIGDEVFPFLRTFRGDAPTYARHMRDARYTIPTSALLAKVVDMLDTIPLGNSDVNGDLYEYMLSKIASAGVNGQFRTPRHVIELMVQMMDPQPGDVICDPAAGTAGFLVEASGHVREHYPEFARDPKALRHFHHAMFNGYDFDNTMLRIGSMNMQMHGVQNANISYRDSLSNDAAADRGRYSLILANPPFAGSLDYEATANDLLAVAKTKKTELLFLALFLKALKIGGRAAVVVPDGVLFGSSKAHKDLRKALVEDQKLDGVVKLPSGVFKPYAGVSTESGGTDHVWFYDVQADGFSLDDKRNPIEANDLPDVLARWKQRDGSELERARTDRSFCVPKADIVAQGYDLSINRYKEIVHEEVEHRAPLDIIADIEALQTEIVTATAELKAMLS
jgi:type I restriction enzyme M protein